MVLYNPSAQIHRTWSTYDTTCLEGGVGRLLTKKRKKEKMCLRSPPFTWGTETCIAEQPVWATRSAQSKHGCTRIRLS